MTRRIELETEDGKLGEIVDEVLAKMARGETVDVEQYAADHDDVADVLRHAIPALRAVAQSSSSVGGAALDSPSSRSGSGDEPIPPNRTLGDYQILRELGRGGMGVVYEAEQTSLGRKVALKVLPFAGMVRENALQRFHNEVRAAGTLDHPNIVSIYSVGEQRGVHYYAMQLVRGHSLAEVIAQLSILQNGGRSLTAESISKVALGSEKPAAISDGESTEQLPCRVAGQPAPSTQAAGRADGPTIKASTHDREFYRSLPLLVAQAADALEHAHDRGVLHRDIKPGNLMLDAQSQIYVTDFGLARIETDAAMTMTGDLIGTLRYMSPEQALAKLAVIDHRSDIYSLGITLYELLTLEPAFAGSDRQELLKQIAFEDPTRPRQLNRSIPAELETIVLKAIEKNPDDRYASAGEMASDLRAFLDNLPIQAKRPTIAQRIVKWTRRHRTLVNTAAATLVIAIAIGGGLLWQERSQTLAAFAQVSEQQQEAERKRIEAERNLKAAMDAVERLLANVSNPQLAKVPGLQDNWASMLNETIEFFDRFKADSGSTPDLDYRAAKVFLQFGHLMTVTKPESDDVIRNYERGLELAKNIVLKEPKRSDFRELLGELYLGCADHYWLPRPISTEESEATTEQHFQDAQQCYARLALENPGNQNYEKMQGFCFYRMAGFYIYRSPNDPRIDELLERATQLGHETNILRAWLANQREDRKLAAKHYRKEIEVYRLDSENYRADRRRYSVGTKLHWANSGATTLADDYPEDAEWLWQEAIRTAHDFLKDFPSHRDYRRLYDGASSGYSGFLLREERRDQAIAKLDALIQSDPAFHTLRALFLANLGSTEEQLTRLDGAIKRFPAHGEYYFERARILATQGALEDALVDLNQLLELEAYHQKGYRSRGELLVELGEYRRAIDDFEKAVETDGIGLWLYKRRAVAHFGLGQYTQALADLKKAVGLQPADTSVIIRITPEKVAACPDAGFRSDVLQLADRVVQLNEENPFSRLFRGVLLEVCGQTERAWVDLAQAIQRSADKPKQYNNVAWRLAIMPDLQPDSFPRAIALAEQAVAQKPGSSSYWNLLGIFQYRAGDYQTAIKSLEKSVKLSDGRDFGYDGIFLSMAHWKLGNKEEARQYYNRSLAWAEQNSVDETLSNFFTEATGMIVANKVGNEDQTNTGR